MTQLNAGELLDIVASGTASTMLAKRWQSDQLVNVNNMTLEKLLNNEKALNKAKKEKGEFTQKEKEEKKENQGFKKLLREKLIKFATRVVFLCI